MPRRKHIPEELKDQIAQKASFLCEYCKSPKRYSPGPFNIEHIVPISKGGNSDVQNLAYSCSGCNGHKYNKIEASDPIDELVVPLFNPRKDSWSDHFIWSEDGLLIIGISPTGRASTETFRLNRKELINLRKILLVVGEHPPNFLSS